MHPNKKTVVHYCVSYFSTVHQVWPLRLMATQTRSQNNFSDGTHNGICQCLEISQVIFLHVRSLSISLLYLSRHYTLLLINLSLQLSNMIGDDHSQHVKSWHVCLFPLMQRDISSFTKHYPGLLILFRGICLQSILLRLENWNVFVVISLSSIINH